MATSKSDSSGLVRPRAVSLCTGYGGLDRAIELLTGASPSYVAEIDPAAAGLLALRFPGVPNLGDVKLINWDAIRHPVEILTAGYPCQPFSEAGKCKGADDPRHLWPHVLDAVRRLRPRLVVLENVRNHLRIGFPEVLADLAAIGFDAQWTVLRASDVGACHARARLFVVAYPTGLGLPAWAGLRSGDQAPDGWRLAHHHGGSSAADASGEQRADQPAGSDGPALTLWPFAGAGGGVGVRDLPEGVDVDRRGSRVVAWGAFEPAVRRHERLIGYPPPYPLNDAGRLSERFVEWMMALPPGWVTDLLGRSSALRLLGNGVFPPAAVAAVHHLFGRVEAQAVAA